MHEELKGLFSALPEVSRRTFVVTSLTAGFAFAVEPIQEPTTITTSTEGLIAGEVKIPVKDGEIPAYRAMPVRGRDFPVVLVVQEIFGVHEHIKDVCRRLAKEGYLAIAAEMYARQGDVSKLDRNQIMSVVSRVPDAQVMADLDATAAWARKNNGHASKLSITGFCWGGRIVWLYAAHNPKLTAGIAWYGRLTGTKTELQPTHPLEVVKEIKAPVLGLYGGADGGIPNETVEQMQKALKENGKPAEIRLYPDTPHAFHADYRPSYRKEQAQDGWARLLEWLKKNGGR